MRAIFFKWGWQSLAWLLVGCLVGGAVLTSLLTLYVLARVWTMAFWRRRVDAPEGALVLAAPPVLLDDVGDVAYDERDDVGKMPTWMVVPTLALIALGLSLSVLAGPIFAYTQRAAAEVLDRGEYISTVLSVGTP